MRWWAHVHGKVDVDVRAASFCDGLFLGSYRWWLSLRHVVRMMIRPLVGHRSIIIPFLTIHSLFLALSLSIPFSLSVPLSLTLLLLIIVTLVSGMILIIHVVAIRVVIRMLI